MDLRFRIYDLIVALAKNVVNFGAEVNAKNRKSKNRRIFFRRSVSKKYCAPPLITRTEAFFRRLTPLKLPCGTRHILFSAAAVKP